MALEAGTRLGPYEIVSLLGKGGMGEVYRARDTRLDRDVAIKVLPAELSKDETYRKRLEREAKTISQLQHPNVCMLLDIGSEDGNQFLVLEYLDGETLEDRLRQGPVPIGDVLRIGSEIAEAIDAAHRAGVVHRDLKPGNVMLTATGTKVLDFGLAKGLAPGYGGSDPNAPTATRALTGEGSIIGTLPYMAPEQLEGHEADARTDIWALGCVLYEMVTAERPFGGDSQASLIGSIMQARPEPPSQRQPGSPERLDWVVSRCLHKDPESRTQSARAVSIELAEIGASPTSDPDAAAMPASADLSPSGALAGSAEPETGESWPRRYIFAALALLLFGAAGWWFWSQAQRVSEEADASRLEFPHLAVLPFDNFTSDPELDQMALGIPEDILTHLTGAWSVINRNTSFAHKGENVCDAAQEMGAKVVMEGSLRKDLEQQKITVRLIGCPEGTQLWADSFDLGVGESLSLQKKTARRIVESMQQELVVHLFNTSAPFWYLNRRTPKDNATALSLFQKAARLKPTEARWRFMTTVVHRQTLREGWAESVQETIEAMDRASQECIDLDPRNWGCHGSRALVYEVRGEGERMIAAAKLALDLRGRLPDSMGDLGRILAVVGRSDEAIEILEEAMLLSPRDPRFPDWIGHIAEAHFAAGRHEAARDAALRSIEYEANEQASNSLATTYQVLAASYALLDQLDEAKEALDDALRLRPLLDAEWVFLFYSTAEPEHRRRLLEGLRIAGLEG